MKPLSPAVPNTDSLAAPRDARVPHVREGEMDAVALVSVEEGCESLPCCLQRVGVTWNETELRQVGMWLVEKRRLRRLLGCAKALVYHFGMGGKVTAEDVFHTVFARVFDPRSGVKGKRFIDKYDPQRCKIARRCPFLNWLVWLMRWEVLEQVKKKRIANSRNRQASETTTPLESLLGEDDDRIESWEFEQDLEQILERLEPGDREILTLRKDDFSPAEIAERLGISYRCAFNATGQRRGICEQCPDSLHRLSPSRHARRLLARGTT